MKKKAMAILGLLIVIFIGACGGDDNKDKTSPSGASESTQPAAAENSDYDPKRGEGQFDESNVTIGALDAAMAAKGKAIAETKCFSCHKITDEKLVGPGWKGVSTKHTPYWLMNFITNPDPMIDKDPEVQAQLELCLVRMPNQNLADQEAREIVEFMRQNDGVK
jgi:mono/diheme cytochrome c family protein